MGRVNIYWALVFLTFFGLISALLEKARQLYCKCKLGATAEPRIVIKRAVKPLASAMGIYMRDNKAIGRDTPEFTLGEFVETSHGAGNGRRTKNPLPLGMGSVNMSEIVDKLNKSAAQSGADLLIEKITNRSISKEILMNSSLDFSGELERDIFERYKRFIYTLSYLDARSIGNGMVYNIKEY